MGHYKTIRGWIQLDRGLLRDLAKDKNIPSKINYREFFNKIKDWISTNEPKYSENIKDSFCLHEGFDGAIFLFVGTRVKDYGNEIEKFVRDFITKFPIGDGFISFDEWEHEIEPREKVWLIRDGKISETRADYMGFIK